MGLFRKFPKTAANTINIYISYIMIPERPVFASYIMARSVLCLPPVNKGFGKNTLVVVLMEI